jgi:hypothetical protein
MGGLNRRDFIKLSGMTVGGLALGNVLSGCNSSSSKVMNAPRLVGIGVASLSLAYWVINPAHLAAYE